MSKCSHKTLKEERIESIKEEQSKMFFDDTTEMIEIIELIYNKSGQPIDFYIKNTNTSFFKFLNKIKKQLIPKKTPSTTNHLEENLLSSFARVDKTGNPISFKNYGTAFEKHYFVTVWKVSQNKVGISFSDITDNTPNNIEIKRNLESEKKIEKRQNAYFSKKG